MRKLFSVLRSLRAPRFLVPMALFFLTFGSVAARADTIDYTFSGYLTDIEFSLDSHAAGAFVLSDRLVFQVTANWNGVTDSNWSLVLGTPGSETPFDLNLVPIIHWFDYDPTDQNFFYTNKDGVITLNTGTFIIDTYWTLTAVDAPATAVTPEPASLVLLATGLMGMAFFYRRRLFVSANAIV